MVSGFLGFRHCWVLGVQNFLDLDAFAFLAVEGLFLGLAKAFDASGGATSVSPGSNGLPLTTQTHLVGPGFGWFNSGLSLRLRGTFRDFGA